MGENLPSGIGILLAAFGTSEPEAEAAYQAINQAYEKLGVPVVWAYTSNIIRAKLAKFGKRLDTPREALDRLAAQGVIHVRVQSLHIAAGEEYTQLERGIYASVLRQPGRFQSVCMGRPLLESERDMQEVLDALLNDFSKKRRSGDAVVLMGHGHPKGMADLQLYAAQVALRQRDPLFFLATVQGSLNFHDILHELKTKNVKRVWLAPFLVVAGNHARNDLVGNQADSWASQLNAAKMQVFPYLKGLGEIAGVQDVFVRHTLETHDNLLQVKGVN